MEMCKSMQIFQKTVVSIRAPCPKLFLAIWSGTSRTSSMPGTVTKWGFEASNWKIVGKVLWSGHFPNLSLKIILQIHMYKLKLKIIVLENYDDIFWLGQKASKKLRLPLLEWYMCSIPFFQHQNVRKKKKPSQLTVVVQLMSHSPLELESGQDVVGYSLSSVMELPLGWKSYQSNWMDKNDRVARGRL